MRTPIFQVDAFTTRRFGGNPAAVMVFAEFAEDCLNFDRCKAVQLAISVTLNV